MDFPLPCRPTKRYSLPFLLWLAANPVPDAAIRPIPSMPIAAATPDSMTSNTKSVAATSAINRPRPNIVLFIRSYAVREKFPKIIFTLIYDKQSSAFSPDAGSVVPGQGTRGRHRTSGLRSVCQGISVFLRILSSGVRDNAYRFRLE